MAKRSNEPDLKSLETKLDALTDAIERLTIRVDQLVDFQGVGKSQDTVSPEKIALLSGMTAKQHIALQLILAGKSNREIAQVLGVSENGAKVHVRRVAAKLGANSRAQIISKMLPVFKAIDPKDYKLASGGLPKSWAIHFYAKPEEPDPFAELYTSE